MVDQTSKDGDQNHSNAPVHKPVGRRLIVVGVVVAVIMVLGGAGYVAWSRLRVHTGRPASSSATKSASTPAESLSDPSFLAQQQALNGDYDGAQTALDKAIASAKDNKSKGALYEAKATIAYNAAKYQDALGMAQQAEQLNPTDNSAYLIAMNDESLGNKSTALGYYQKALARLDTVTRQRSPDVVQTYQQKIKELSQ